MAGFCIKCGSPLSGPFCTKCGHPANAPQASPPSQGVSVTPSSGPTPVAPPASAAKGGGLGKFLMVLAAVFMIFVVAAAGAVFYGLHWAKRKMSNYSAGIIGQSKEQTVLSHGTSCALLPKGELQEILSVSIEKSQEVEEGSSLGCAYYTDAEGFARLNKMALEESQRESARAQASQKPGEKIDNPLELLKHTKDMQGIVKTLSMQEPPKDGQVFSFTVDRNAGSDSWTGIRTAMALVPGFAEVPGVGDHAMVGTFGHAFCAMKGSSMIQLNTLYVPDAETRGAEIARRILSRL